MISTFFIDHPIFANVIAIITMILGLVCFFILPVSQYPHIVPPTIQVSATYPGANAEVVAATVGVPIEQAINGIENSLYISSTSSSLGAYTLTITFEVGTDLNKSVALVQNMVNSAISQLPLSVTVQGVNVRKVSTDILLVVSLYAEDERFSEEFLSNYAIVNLINPLARIPGVGQTKTFGAGPYSMRIWLDPGKLRQYRLTAADVMDAVAGQNVQVAAGRIGAPPTPPDQAFQFTVSTLGRLEDAAQFQDIIIKSERDRSARIVRIRDVARIELSQQSYSSFAAVSGHKAADIPVFALPDANALEVADRVRAAMKDMQKDFPPGLSYEIHYDTTVFVRQVIRDVYKTLLQAGVLVLVVILVFLQNWRATLVPATTVPVTIIGAFAAMAMLGFTINLMTMFALILSIGIVVDDAIVIVENSAYYIERGMPPREATIKAMGEMTGPVLGITLVLTAVFLPAAFLPGITGQLFRQFALVIGSTTIISAVNALTLKPAQCALWLRPVRKQQDNFFYRSFNRGYSFVEREYIGVVRWMVGRAPAMMVLFFALIILAGWRFALHPAGFLPEEDQGYAICVARLPDAASQVRVREVARRMSDLLKKTPGLYGWVTIGGFSILDAATVANVFTTFLVFEPWDKRGAALSQERILDRVRREFAEIRDAVIIVLIPPSIRGLGQAGGFQMMVEDRGNLGIQELQSVVRDMIREAEAQPGLRQLTTPFSASSPQLYLEIDRTKVESLDVPLAGVFNTLQAYLGSSFVNLFNKFNQVFQVYVQADAPFRLQPEIIRDLYTRNARGDMVPLGTLLDVRRVLSSELVTRYNLYPAASLFGSAAPGTSFEQAISLMERVAARALPRGMSYDWTATAYQQKQVGRQAYFIYLLSITLVYFVLAALYESWTNPAAVIMTVPLAIIGVLLGLMVRGFENDLYTQVGLVLMIALASKNAILIVEFARDLHGRGMSIADAAVTATQRRFRPIVMTSFAFILGIVPLLVARGAGAASQRSIGTVVFGGMISSTLLAIPFVPVFFVIMQRLDDRMRKKNKPGEPAKMQASGGAGEEEKS